MNGGVNKGLDPIKVYQFERANGLATLAALPWSTSPAPPPAPSLFAGAAPFHWTGIFQHSIPSTSDISAWQLTVKNIKFALRNGYPVWWNIGYDTTDQTSLHALHANDTWRPVPHKKRVGGHALVIIGYDENLQRFKFRNSWLPGWGDGSNNGFISYDSLMNVTELLALPYISQVALF